MPPILMTLVVCAWMAIPQLDAWSREAANRWKLAIGPAHSQVADIAPRPDIVYFDAPPSEGAQTVRR